MVTEIRRQRSGLPVPLGLVVWRGRLAEVWAWRPSTGTHRPLAYTEHAHAHAHVSALSRTQLDSYQYSLVVLSLACSRAHWLVGSFIRSLARFTIIPCPPPVLCAAKGESESISLLQRLRGAGRKVLCKQPTHWRIRQGQR